VDYGGLTHDIRVQYLQGVRGLECLARYYTLQYLYNDVHIP